MPSKRRRAPPRSFVSPTFNKILMTTVALLSLGFSVMNLSDFGQANFEDFHFQNLPNMKLNERHHSLQQCDNYGSRTDPYFKHYGGLACTLTQYEAENPIESVHNFVNRIEVVTKVFEDHDAAFNYYWRFWGRHMYEPIPYMMLADTSLSTTPIGHDPHSFVWDPFVMGVPIPSDDAALKHVTYLFLTGRTFVKITASSFINSYPPDLTPGFVADLAEILESNIKQQEPSRIARTIRQSYNTVTNSVLDVFEKCEIFVKDLRHQVTKQAQTPNANAAYSEFQQASKASITNQQYAETENDDVIHNLTTDDIDFEDLTGEEDFIDYRYQSNWSTAAESDQMENSIFAILDRFSESKSMTDIVTQVGLASIVLALFTLSAIFDSKKTPS